MWECAIFWKNKACTYVHISVSIEDISAYKRKKIGLLIAARNCMGENLNVLNTVQCTQCTALHPLNSQTAGGACLARTEAVVRSDDQHTTLVRGCATRLEVMGKATYLAMASYYLNPTWMTERILSFIAPGIPIARTLMIVPCTCGCMCTAQPMYYDWYRDMWWWNYRIE